MRHLPNIPIPATPNYSESSFQIPTGLNATADLLMAQDGGDFFQGMDQALSTPAVSKTRRRIASLAHAEPTPNPRERPTPVRYSMRLRQRLASPQKPAVSSEPSAASTQSSRGLESDSSFEISLSQTTNPNDLIMADNGRDFLRPGEGDLLATPLSPAKKTRPSPEVESRHLSSAVPSVSNGVGTDSIAIGLSLPSSARPPSVPPLTTEDEPSNSDVCDTQPVAMASELNNTVPQLKADIITSSNDEDQDIATRTSRTQRSSKKSAARILHEEVPGEKSKRVCNSISCANLRPPTNCVWYPLLSFRLPSTAGSQEPGRQR